MADPTNRWTQRCSSCGEYWWDAHVCPHSLAARQTLPTINPAAKTVQEMTDEINSLRAQVAALEMALRNVLPWVVTQEVACNGLKCREPICMSCDSDSEANAQLACDAYGAASAALGDKT